MRGVSVVLVAILVGVSSCGVSAANWSAKGADAMCDFQKRCAPANFWSTWVNMDECLNAQEGALDAEALEKVDCVFDENQAKACLKAYEKSCKDAGQQTEFLFAPCLAVYNCGTAPLTGTPTGDPTTTGS